jgi:large exoprotein involved in heme utilization and adhesion
VYLKDGTLTAQAVGDGGNLTLEPDFFVMNRGSLVSKSTSANGGNISVFSDYFLVSESVIDASAPFGLPGTVSVSAPNVDLSGVLVALPGTLLGVETLLQPDCGVRLNGNISSFIVLGRGGLPLEPGGFVPSATTALPDEKP